MQVVRRLTVVLLAGVVLLLAVQTWVSTREFIEFYEDDVVRDQVLLGRSRLDPDHGRDRLRQGARRARAARRALPDARGAGARPQGAAVVRGAAARRAGL
jgi:hypothetical protein